MSLARLKRLQRLEARQPRVFRPFDYAGSAAAPRWLLACHAAVAAGKASLVQVYGPRPLASPAKAAVLRELDGIASRMTAGRAG
jgi:hypothetical protein